MKVKLIISYDGTNYCGWQVQPNCTSVQQVLEDALFEITGERTRITGSGRTDAGVHALGQVAHFITNSNVPAERFSRAFNIKLPDDIKVLSSERAEDDFHAVASAKKKTYRYSVYVHHSLLPLKDRYAVQIKKQPDIEKMKNCAKILLGEHDFKSMSASGGGAKTTIRTIYDIKIEQNGESIDFFVTGNGFLYNMVRIMVGTLIAVGTEKIAEKDVVEMLKTGEKKMGIKTLSAKGLTLIKVEY